MAKSQRTELNLLVIEVGAVCVCGSMNTVMGYGDSYRERGRESMVMNARESNTVHNVKRGLRKILRIFHIGMKYWQACLS